MMAVREQSCNRGCSSTVFLFTPRAWIMHNVAEAIENERVATMITNLLLLWLDPRALPAGTVVYDICDVNADVSDISEQAQEDAAAAALRHEEDGPAR